MTTTITSGAHWRNVDVPVDSAPRSFAHIFDPESPEDVPHEAHNFLTYAQALGGASEIVLYRPIEEDDENFPDWVAPIEYHSARHYGPEEDHIEVMLSDWVAIVTTATGLAVEIR